MDKAITEICIIHVLSRLHIVIIKGYCTNMGKYLPELASPWHKLVECHSDAKECQYFSLFV